MTTQSSAIRAKLQLLSSSLDDLDALLDPLFSKGFTESLAELDITQQAKLQTLLPYLIYDCIFIYLKTKGVDPKTHPVVGELDRIRRYFDKLAKAENPETKRVAVDKEAANRFIKHAISQLKPSAPKDVAAEASSSTVLHPPPPVLVPLKVTSKMLEREEYEKALRQEDAENSQQEDENLQVFDDDTQELDQPATDTSLKRRRPAIDPFTGEPEPSMDKLPKEKKKKSSNRTLSDSASGTPPHDESSSTKSTKKKKKSNSNKKK